MNDTCSGDRLAEIEARVTAKYLSSEPWRLTYEACDCGGDYSCGHGMYAQAVVTPEPTPSAADRCARAGEQPKDYDFHRSEMCDFTDADWELMAHARADIPWLVAQLKQARGLAAAWMEDDARRDDEAGITTDPNDRRRRIHIDGQGDAWISAGIDNGVEYIDRIVPPLDGDDNTDQVRDRTGGLREIGRCW